MKIWSFILLFFLTINALCQNKKTTDSLRNQLKTTRDTAKVYVLYEIYRQYAITNSDSANRYINLAIDEALVTGDSLAIAKTYYGRGWIKRRLEDFNNSLIDYHKALGIAMRNNLLKWEMYITNELALMHYSMANFDEALGHNYRSLEIGEITKDNDHISVSLNNIGLIFLGLNDFENGLQYFEKSYDFKIENGIDYDLDISLLNIGICYNGLGRVDQAIRMFGQALQVCEPKCKSQNLSNIYNGLGDSFLKSSRLQEAETQFQLAIESARIGRSTRLEAVALNGMAKVFNARKDYDMAIYFLDKSQALLKDSDFNEEVLNNYILYAELYNSQNNFKMASIFQSKYIQLREKIYGSRLIKNIAGIQLDNEARKNFKILKSKDQLIMLKESQSRQQKIIIAISITLLLVLMTLCILLWKVIRMKSNLNQLLDQKVRSRTEALQQSYIRLERVSFEQKQNLIRLNSKFHSCMATLKGITAVAKRDIDDPKGLNYISKIEQEAEKLNQAASKK